MFLFEAGYKKFLISEYYENAVNMLKSAVIVKEEYANGKYFYTPTGEKLLSERIMIIDEDCLVDSAEGEEKLLSEKLKAATETKDNYYRWLQAEKEISKELREKLKVAEEKLLEKTQVSE